MMTAATQILSRTEEFDPAFMLSLATKETPLGRYTVSRVQEWRDIVSRLDLTPGQIDRSVPWRWPCGLMGGTSRHLLPPCSLMHLRAAYAEKFRSLYKARSVIQLKAMRAVGPLLAEHESKGKAAKYLAVLLQSHQDPEMQSVILELKSCLVQEQEWTSEIRYASMRNILEPLQAARLIKYNYPYTVDPLTFLDTVHYVYRSGE